VEAPTYAPFYLSRAALKKKVGALGVAVDLEKAKDVDAASWRVWHALAEHYTEVGRYVDALHLTSDAARRFPANVVIAMDKAAALYNTMNFEQCLETLEHLEVLPYEGSWEARDLFARTHLRISLEKMRANDWPAALRSLDQSREYPEHLGSGKPWEPDERLQDMLAAVCLKQMRQQEKAESTTRRILDYTDRHGLMWGSEHFAGAIALHLLNETEKANRLMTEWEKQAPTDNLRKWTAAQLAGNIAEALKLETANAHDPRFLVRIEAAKAALTR
jgi:tetratricopeptide (TPR) repeat protein